MYKVLNNKKFGKFVLFAAAGMLLIINFFKTVPVQSYEWGLYFEKPQTVPVPNLEDEKINPLGAYYHGNTEKNIIYLTFDSGYENGNTEKILQALKAHNAPAIFFMTGQNIDENPELVKLILSYGQKVGNHSYHHPDMSKKSRNDFEKELDLTRRAYKKITGEDIPKFYRPPEGKFSLENLKTAQSLGYTTVFWSSAYVDWDPAKQPSEETAFARIKERTFPGAVFLLHSVSKTNADILDRQLTLWEEQGYSFGDVANLANDYNT